MVCKVSILGYLNYQMLLHYECSAGVKTDAAELDFYNMRFRNMTSGLGKWY